jgi:hypothetical protein
VVDRVPADVVFYRCMLVRRVWFVFSLTPLFDEVEFCQQLGGVSLGVALGF